MSGLRLDQQNSSADVTSAIEEVAHRQRLGAGDFLVGSGAVTVVGLASPIKALPWNLATGAQRTLGAWVERPPAWFRGKVRATIYYTTPTTHASQVINLKLRLAFVEADEDIAAPAAYEELDTTIPVASTGNRRRLTFTHLFDTVTVSGKHEDGQFFVERATASDTYANSMYFSGALLEYLPIQEA